MVGNFGGAPVVGNDKTKIVVLVLVFAVLGFAGVLFAALKKNPENVIQVSEASNGNIKVLFPIQKIERGIALDAGMFEYREVPSDTLPEGVVSDFQAISGKYSKVDIIPRQGQPLIEEYISALKPVELGTKIPQGSRAVTIRVDDISSIEGWARPGAKVDVLWTTIVGGQQKLITLVENAEVISSNGVMNNDQVAGKAPGSVTLLVTEEDSKKVIFSSSSGSLSLSLRNDQDDAKTGQTGPIQQSDILGERPKEVIIDNKPVQVCTGKIEVGGKKYCITQDGKMILSKEE